MYDAREEVLGAGAGRVSRGSIQLAKEFGFIPRAMGTHKGFQQQSDLVRLAFYEDGSDCREGKVGSRQMREGARSER